LFPYRSFSSTPVPYGIVCGSPSNMTPRAFIVSKSLRQSVVESANSGALAALPPDESPLLGSLSEFEIDRDIRSSRRVHQEPSEVAHPIVLRHDEAEFFVIASYFGFVRKPGSSGT
jgi:hypothetical protein